MLMTLGSFIFEINTASFDALERSIKHKWTSHERIGMRSAHQYLGVDDETISLSGTIYPAFAGKAVSLADIKKMASEGKPQILISGTGHVLGDFMILEVTDKRTWFMDNGEPQKIEFSISLLRYDDDSKELRNIVDALSN